MAQRRPCRSLYYDDSVRPAIALTTVVAFAIAASTAAVAQPSVPATFYGSVTVDGEPAQAGLEVRGFINGADCSQSAPGERPVIRDGETTAYVLYVVHESQRPGCARDGSTISFTIGGRTTVQTAVWKPGPMHLDLSVGDAPPIPLPSPTGTIAAAVQTAQGQGAGVVGTPGTSTTALARPTGTPPTDDVRFDGTPVPGGTPLAPNTADGSDDGGAGLATVLGVLAVLAIAGGALGVVLARKQRAKGA